MTFSYLVSGEAYQSQYFQVRPSNSSVQEGENVMIPCVVGNQAGVVQWVKDGFAYVVEPGKYLLKSIDVFPTKCLIR